MRRFHHLATVITLPWIARALQNFTVDSDNRNLIQYTGFTWEPDTNCHRQSVSWTPDVGSYFLFDFTGVAIYVFGTASSGGGVITFELDGVTSEYDRYAPGDGAYCDVAWLAETGLANGTHTLKGTLTSPSPANSTGFAYLELQYLLYTVLEPGDSVATSSSSTLTPTTSVLGTASTSSAAATSVNDVSLGRSGQSLSQGAKDGIIAASVLVVGLLGLLTLFLYRRRQRQRRIGGAAQLRKLRLKTDLDGSTMEPLMLMTAGEEDERKGFGGTGTLPETQIDPWSPGDGHSVQVMPERVHEAPSYTVSVKAPGRPPSAPASMVHHDTPPSRPASWIAATSDGGHRTLSAPSASRHSASIADTDVDRIAARVASIINQNQQPRWDGPPSEPPPGVDLTGGGEFIPPPSYDPSGKRPMS